MLATYPTQRVMAQPSPAQRDDLTNGDPDASSALPHGQRRGTATPDCA